MKTANRLSFFANALMIFVLIAGLTVPSTSVRAGPPDMPWINVDAENNWVQAHTWTNGTVVELFINGESQRNRHNRFSGLGSGIWSPIRYCHRDWRFCSSERWGCDEGSPRLQSGGDRLRPGYRHGIGRINTRNAGGSVCQPLPPVDVSLAPSLKPITPACGRRPLSLLIFPSSPESSGWASEWDTDGDATWYNWNIPSPWINVSARNGWVDAHGWAKDSEVELFINAESKGTATIADMPWGVGAEFQADIAAGNLVEVKGAGITKSLIVSGLAVTGFDLVANTVSGNATPGAGVEVCANVPDTCVSRSATADGSTGAWTTGTFDPDITLAPGSNGWAAEYDGDGDATWYDWNVPNRWINASAENDWVQAHDWPKDELVTLTINGIERASTTVLEVNPGDLLAEFQTGVETGDDIQISGLSGTKSLIVSGLTVTGFDLAANTISGNATPGADVEVCADVPGNCVSRSATADGVTGAWTTGTFSPDYTLVPGSSGWVAERDGDGDATWYNWNVPKPAFGVRANDEFIEGWNWPLDAIVTITIDDPATGETPDFTGESGCHRGPMGFKPNLVQPRFQPGL